MSERRVTPPPVSERRVARVSERHVARVSDRHVARVSEPRVGLALAQAGHWPRLTKPAAYQGQEGSQRSRRR
jgi:hypothetical protein